MIHCAWAAECANSVAGSVRSEEMISMAETQGDIYVRKHVFDARMDRLEMLLEKTTVEIKAYVDKAVGEIKAENAQFKSEIRAEIGEVRNDIRVLTARVASLENVFYWGLGGFAVILASAVIIPSIVGFLKKIFQPSVTLEDVERIVNTAIANHLSGGKTE